MTKREFESLNQRRIGLLFKGREIPLSDTELHELRILQKQCSEYINAKYPLPWDRLRKAEKSLAKTRARQ